LGEEVLIASAVSALGAQGDRVAVADAQTAVDPGLVRLAPVGDFFLDAVWAPPMRTGYARTC